VLEDEAAAKQPEDPVLSGKNKEVMASQPRQGSECVIGLQAEAVKALMLCRHLCVCEAPICMLHLCPLYRAPVVEEPSTSVAEGSLLFARSPARANLGENR